jgi:hypothetical protein
MKKFIPLIFLLSIMLLFNSCVEAPANGRADSSSSSITGGDLNGDGNGITNGDGDGLGNDESEPVAKVEIRHLIEPKIDDSDTGGSYKRKMTIPKNYNKELYIAGINVSSLPSENIMVRFNFGLNSAPIVIQGTISTAPGLTSSSSVDVIILDMKRKPFQDIQLVYDLFDYNTYDFSGVGSDPGALIEPVGFNRDDKLFCRGLNLEHDSTFTGSILNGCNDATDTCKYAYAKVVDKGLVASGVPDIPVVPSEANIQSGNDSYYNDTDAIKLARCLPDNPIHTGTNYVYDSSRTFTTFESTELIDSITYYYRGPYRPINQENWQISGEALKGEVGLFGGVFDDNTNGLVDDSEVEYGYLSKLFPLYSKFDLLKDTEYLGSAVPDAQKVLSAMASNNESLYMDGCNLRANTVDDITGEHIGSCNVTATIEIISIDDVTKKETVVDITDEVKLQLVKPSYINTAGDDVLLTSFKQCSSSNQCGSDSCCINKRCWTKDIVGQCIEDLPNYGNLVTGDTCNSDVQCSSLCCNKIDGRCAPHDTVSQNPSYCSKPIGQFCVAKEWCQKQTVQTCAIVSTGLDKFGNVTCAKRCESVEVFGECIAADGAGVGTCSAACSPPDTTVYNPNDPNRCDEMITVSQLKELANNPVCE